MMQLDIDVIRMYSDSMREKFRDFSELRDVMAAWQCAADSPVCMGIYSNVRMPIPPTWIPSANTQPAPDTKLPLTKRHNGFLT
jgi:hypothetical protein